MNYRYNILMALLIFSLAVVVAAPIISQPLVRWSFVPGGELSGPPVWARDGRMLFGGQDRWLYALDNGGAVVWRYDLRRLPVTGIAVGRDGTAYAGLSGNRIVAVAPSGRHRWSVIGPTAPVAVIPSPAGLVYTAYASGQISAHTSRGATVWVARPGETLSTGPVVDGSGRLIVALGDGSIVALDVAGRRVWVLRLDQPVTAFAASGILFAGDSTGSIHAIDSSGRLLWSTRVSGTAVRAILIDDADAPVVLDSEGSLIRLSDGGAIRWRAHPPGPGVSAVALGSAGTLYAGTGDGRLLGLDAEGRLLFDVPSGRDSRVIHLGITPSGRLIAGAADWVVDFFCIDSCDVSGEPPSRWAHPRGSTTGAAVSATFLGFSPAAYRDILDYIFLEQLVSSGSVVDLQRFLMDLEHRVATDRVGTAYVYAVDLLGAIAEGGAGALSGQPVPEEHRVRALRLLGEISDYRASIRFARALRDEPSPVVQAAVVSMMGRIESDPGGDAVRSISDLVQREIGTVPMIVSEAAVEALTRLAIFNGVRVRETAVETLVWMSASSDVSVQSRIRARNAIRIIE